MDRARECCVILPRNSFWWQCLLLKPRCHQIPLYCCTFSSRGPSALPSVSLSPAREKSLKSEEGNRHSITRQVTIRKAQLNTRAKRVRERLPAPAWPADTMPRVQSKCADITNDLLILSKNTQFGHVDSETSIVLSGRYMFYYHILATNSTGLPHVEDQGGPTISHISVEQGVVIGDIQTAGGWEEETLIRQTDSSSAETINSPSVRKRRTCENAGEVRRRMSPPARPRVEMGIRYFGLKKGFY
ncbi:hypothetical protein J6590_005208 [Homalodisca vitripennis]|nr:hypothetical protein J6590_005208 [Homalodisca vitripennis]